MSANRSPAVLVMTATITPPEGMPLSVRNDPKMRLDDYCRALEFYLGLPSHLVNRILFLDNSSSDLSALLRIAESVEHDKKVEFVGFRGDYKPEFGKGYGEFQMLDYGLSKCSFLSKTDVLWKVTGRLIVLNMERLVETAPQDYAVYCDLRAAPFIFKQLGGRYGIGGQYWDSTMDLRVFSCTVNAYDRFLRRQYIHLPNRFPEHYFFNLMMEARNQDRGIVSRFRIQPQLAGYAGWNNASYQSLAFKTKGSFRAAIRLTVPWLWL